MLVLKQIVVATKIITSIVTLATGVVVIRTTIVIVIVLQISS